MGAGNIVLIGMPGAGKSTTGVLLAKTLNMPFIDTDLLIQQREKRLLQDIINHEGIKSFLSIEEKVLLDLEVSGHVIATGGSAVYSDAGMKHLKANGTAVYLRLAYIDIEMRIKNIKSRGIAMDKDQNLYDLYVERVCLYEKYSDITVDCTNKDMEAVVLELDEKLKNIL